MASRLLQTFTRSYANSFKKGGDSSHMFTNPYIKRFRERSEVNPQHFKQSTGLTGLFVSENPHHELRTEYARLLRILTQMPATYSYRKYTEQLANERLALVESEPDIAKLEEKIGMGQIEEVIMQAKYETEAAESLLETRAWEPLVAPAPKGQWEWPI